MTVAIIVALALIWFVFGYTVGVAIERRRCRVQYAAAAALFDQSRYFHDAVLYRLAVAAPDPDGPSFSAVIGRN